MVSPINPNLNIPPNAGGDPPNLLGVVTDVREGDVIGQSIFTIVDSRTGESRDFTILLNDWGVPIQPPGASVGLNSKVNFLFDPDTGNLQKIIVLGGGSP